MSRTAQVNTEKTRAPLKGGIVILQFYKEETKAETEVTQLRSHQVRC